MKDLQYTIRKVSPQLDAKLRARAAREHKSLNRVVLEQLERTSATPIAVKAPNGDYDDLVGSWVDDPDFDKAIEQLRTVDPKDWQ